LGDLALSCNPSYLGGPEQMGWFEVETDLSRKTDLYQYISILIPTLLIKSVVEIPLQSM
jgi:hypothetical protein